MAPKPKRKRNPLFVSDSDGIFSGMTVFLVDSGVQARRLQIWKVKLEQKGALIDDNLSRCVTHVLAMNWGHLKKKIDDRRLAKFKGSILQYQWLEDSLKAGEMVAEDSYKIKEDDAAEKSIPGSSPESSAQPDEQNLGTTGGSLHSIKTKSPSPESSGDSGMNAAKKEHNEVSPKEAECPMPYDDELGPSGLYNPPDLNMNITGIFRRLIDIYRALGDDRRSYSYSKAIPVIEKLPFKIERPEQIRDLPAIGKSLQDHVEPGASSATTPLSLGIEVMEIVTTGKLSKLEHFEQDEKVKTISLFGEVWGVGHATALKLYEKGHRTLEDLKTEESLTKAQRLGLKYFDDIRARIPRHEATEMVKLLQKTAEDILPGVTVIGGGSYRRGKSSCGDLDIIITHPDGQSHKGFLAKYLDKLKGMKFVREDLKYNTHSEQEIELGADTYFGFCTYPGRELRHRIDIKVYPRDIFAFGLIHWTGNDTLNRRLRILAGSKGYRLDDNGLFPATAGSDGNRGTRARVSLPLKTEREVFDFLGFPWLEPHERNL